MAIRINCGKPEWNEVAALKKLSAELPDDWALLTNIPRHLTGSGSRGREIDALALSPLGAVVIELKHFGGLITVSPLGEWFVGGKLLNNRKGDPQYPLQQAGKAAQTLKSALGEPVRSVYIEACAVATMPSAQIRFTDPNRRHPVMSLDDAIVGIPTLAGRTRGVSYPALRAFFNLIGHTIPPELDQLWRAATAARQQSDFQKRGQHPRVRRGQPSINRERPQKPTSLSFGTLMLAMIAGSLLGWYVILPLFAG